MALEDRDIRSPRVVGGGRRRTPASPVHTVPEGPSWLTPDDTRRSTPPRRVGPRIPESPNLEGLGDALEALIGEGGDGVGRRVGDLVSRLRPGGGGAEETRANPNDWLTAAVLAIADGEMDFRDAVAFLMDELNLDFDEAEGELLRVSSDLGIDLFAGPDEGTAIDDLFGDIFDLLGGGGGGGRRGGAAPVYQGPDRGLVEDYVKSRLVSLVGSADEGRIGLLADLFFDADKRKFNGESIDPKQAVTEKIRSYADYKRIHKNRTDAEDEDTWIGGRHSALIRAGVSGEMAEGLAVDFAQAGVSEARAGELSQLRRVGSQTSQALPGFFQNVRSGLQTVASKVR